MRSPRLLPALDYYNDPGVRALHHALKAGSDSAARRMARDMAQHVPADAVLIPMPSRKGYGGAGLLLAQHLAEVTGRPVVDALRGASRPSLYAVKKRGGDPSSIDLGLYLAAPLPPGTPVIVDNIVGTGHTARSALRAVPGAVVLVHAVDRGIAAIVNPSTNPALRALHALRDNWGSGGDMGNPEGFLARAGADVLAIRLELWTDDCLMDGPRQTAAEARKRGKALARRWAKAHWPHVGYEDLGAEGVYGATWAYAPATADEIAATDPDAVIDISQEPGMRQNPLMLDSVDAAFKRWFKGSKVVDADGQPLVVYHGTDTGGFYEFDPYSSRVKGRRGVFFTSDFGMARSYVRGSPEKDDPTPPIYTSWEDFLRNHDERHFTIEEDGGLYNVWGADGYRVLRDFDPAEDDEDSALHDLNSQTTVQEGVYAVYLRIENPMEIDAKGANWDEVPVEGEDEDGSPQTQTYSTNELALMALDAGCDGLIIRDVSDSGSNYYNGSGDVFVVFNANQIKSAGHNAGTFDPDDDDIRRNPLMLDSVDDPFEPAFHKAASKAKRKALCYHGTSTTFFWNIVENGFSFDAERKAWDNTSPGVFVAFNESATSVYASRATTRFGGQPICFVLEVPIKDLGIDVDDRDTHDKGRNWQGMTQGPIPARCITGVLLPGSGMNWGPEVPIKSFIASAKRGAYRHLGIEPKKTTVKVGAATPIDPEHAVLDYLVDVLNYTSLTDWLVQPKWGKLSRIVLENILSGRLPSWRMMDARQWLAAVEKMTGEKNEEPYFDSAVEENTWMRRPFYAVAQKFSGSTVGVDELRGIKRR
jgi:hypothetical protein